MNVFVRVKSEKILAIDNKKIFIELKDGTRFEIIEDITGGIRINKLDLDSGTISIEPCVSNEIIVK